MAKSLGPEDYGALAVLMSLFYFIAVPNEIIQTVVSKYSSKFKAKKEYGKIKNLLIKFIFNGALIALALFIILIPLFYLYAQFVNVAFSLVVIMGFMIFPSFLNPVTRGILQGTKKFDSLGINMVIDALIKLIVALTLVYFGFRVYGAIFGSIIGAIFGLFFSIIPLKKIIKLKQKKEKIPNIFSYTSPVFFALIAIMFVQNIDVILAKRFFTPIIAGQYAAANLIGKMIFLGTMSITKVLLPVSSEKHENGEDTTRTFIKSFLIISILCICAIIAIVVFQDLLIKTIFTVEYLGIKNILLYLCIAFSIISLVNLILIYGVSINKKVRAWHLVLFCTVQIGIFYFFNQNIVHFSLAMILVSIFLLIGSIILVFGNTLSRT